MDGPFFKRKKGVAYSIREVWEWANDHACWAELKVNICGRIVPLKRGQLSYSHDYLAEAWGWHRSRVARFLKKLEREKLIETNTDMGQLIITLCNYDENQLVPGFHEMDSETQNEIRARQGRDKSETNKNTETIPDNTIANTLGSPTQATNSLTALSNGQNGVPSLANKKPSKRPIRVFEESEIKGSKRGEEAYSPEFCRTEILPGGWCDYAETIGIPNDKIYYSWKRFKDKTSWPMEFKNWKRWIDGEKFRHSAKSAYE